MAYRTRADLFDVDLRVVPPEAVGPLIVQNLSIKGFCVLNAGFEEAALDRAVTDAEALTFYEVNDAVADGLLGQEGSASVADLDIGAEAEQGTGSDLRMLDHAITRIGYMLQPYTGLMNLSFSHRGPGVVHRVGDIAAQAPELTEAEVSKWQTQFLRHRLMAVLFLGPQAGRLELELYEGKDADPLEVETPPGTLVILCPDSLSHKHFCPGEAYALSTFFLTDVGRRRAPEGGWKLVPAAKALEGWTSQRLSDLKELEAQEVELEVPETWHKAMNHAFHRGHMAGVYGDSIHQTATYDMDVWVGAASSGPDYAREVPFHRWDHSEYFDPDPESFIVGKTHCRHGNFMEGVELFDNKFFEMTIEESTELDPHQRLILERGYGALASMGMTKKDLGNSKGGVYVGCETDEWTLQLNKGYKTVDNMLSMFSGRLSFCLNLKGPAVTLTTEGASGLTAAHMASESVLARGWQRTATNDFAVAIGVSLMITPSAWAAPAARGFFSKVGRCLTFDAAADGYIRGDGCAAVAIKAATKVVDGVIQPKDEKDAFLGTIAGAAANHNGKAASLTSPHGPSEQECVARAIRSAAVRPRDVEAVEANSLGSPVRDAVEANSHWSAHRKANGAEAGRDPLCMLALKSSVGNQVEASGTLALLKAIYAAQWGHMAPFLHLNKANPYIDTFGQPLLLANEVVAFSGASSFTGVMAQGFGGSNVYLLAWGIENVAKVLLPPAVTPPQVAYWPGGGGEMERDMAPSERDGYYIVGTWSRWESPQRMEKRGPGMYGFTVTLGMNRWEQFQIWLDGNPDRTLHPGAPRMPQGCPVMGPDPDFEGGAEAARSTLAPTWMIDGRGGFAGYEHGQGIVQRLTDGTSKDEEALAGVDADAFTIGTTEAGRPGDQYEVLLQVKGKWRMVTWEKVQPAERAELPAAAPPGTYFLVGNWDDWGFEEMASDPTTPGVFTGEVEVPLVGEADFQIVRDRDWSQQFYPNPESPSLEDSDSVLGPDDLGYEFSWWRIEGAPGSRYTVRFERSLGADGTEFRRVSWQLAGDAGVPVPVAEQPLELEAAVPEEAHEQPPGAEEAPDVDVPEQPFVPEA